MSGLSYNIPFGPQANCTLEICPIEWSILQYQPSLPASSVFIALFSIALIIHAVEGIRWRSWGFMGSVISGCILEVVGYAGRVMLHDNPFSYNGFLIQIICITVAPVFFCAGIYVTLSQTINLVDVSKSRMKPQLFYWVFIPCDIISLVLQALGGGLSVVSIDLEAVQRGVNISLAGLVFQVATLLVFCGMFIDYIVRCGRSADTRQRLTPRVKFFLGFLFLAIAFVLLRCVYRIVELHDGYFSHWFRDEPLFIALESAVMAAAVFWLNLGHPGLVFGPSAGEKANYATEESPSSTDERFEMAQSRKPS